MLLGSLELHLCRRLLVCQSRKRWVCSDERQHHRQVLAIELSKLDDGADITDYSQYPGMLHICISRSFYTHEDTYIAV
jgi:hypothetical protein